MKSCMSGKINEQLFSAHEHALDKEQCCPPQCGAELVIRNSKRGPFLGCAGYPPECDYIKSLNHNDGHVVKHLGKPCPDCGDELLLRQGAIRHVHWVCWISGMPPYRISRKKSRRYPADLPFMWQGGASYGAQVALRKSILCLRSVSGLPLCRQ